MATNMLNDKIIILGVSSSIAAYKACELVSRLKKLGVEVWVVMTKEAAQLIAPLTFRTLSGNPVITNLFDPELSQMPIPHIALAKKADLILVAPCTANVIGKLANGIADDALTTIVLASTAPKLIAPAMNCEMWRNPVVAKNIEVLKGLGIGIVGPVEGKLACGDEDIGRMSEPADIVAAIQKLIQPKQDLQGKHILITAGGTKEAIDPVRYISNRSSGKMGYALAKVARERGAKVTLISAVNGLAVPLDLKPIKVTSAKEMLDVVLAHYEEADAVIMAAAVGDFKLKPKTAKFKIKKSEHDVSLKLTPTEDILMTLANHKNRNGHVLVGFALETENVIANAKKKLKEKKLDLIVANTDKTFDSEQIEFSVIDAAGEVSDYPRQTKEQAAQEILNRVFK
ncbi:MAG: bifunctional phosphopantothenoylcysteine decarboxylase/phosphopantothenate--cysteine ligase CoaBC [bacterium]